MRRWSEPRTKLGERRMHFSSPLDDVERREMHPPLASAE